MTEEKQAKKKYSKTKLVVGVGVAVATGLVAADVIPQDSVAPVKDIIVHLIDLLISLF